MYLLLCVQGCSLIAVVYVLLYNFWYSDFRIEESKAQDEGPSEDKKKVCESTCLLNYIHLTGIWKKKILSELRPPDVNMLLSYLHTQLFAPSMLSFDHYVLPSNHFHDESF